MGTVHARARDTADIRRDILDDPLEIDNDSRPSAFKLNGVRARVDRVHVDGLNRTKDDIIRSTVNDMFHATDFEDVLLRAQKVRRALDSMGCFRDIGVFIDVSTGPGSTPEGLEVTFQVKELSRIVGGINTTVSENEGNLVLGAKMPNVLGRGEKLQAEYSMGYRSTSNFSVTGTKPFPTKPLVPVVSASVFQQNHEYPWSGYKLLDRGLLLDVAFKTSQYTKHNLQWEGIVRDTSVLNKNTSFKVRESSGPQMKSLIRHIVSIDHRDEPIFPRSGSWVQFSSEVSGLGGGIAYLKSELNVQHNAELSEHVVLQVSGSCGLLHSVFGVGVSERLYLGGAGSVRGFAQRGVGPHDHSHATGGHAFWASGVHIYTPLPFRPGKNGIGELFRSHFFINAGSLAEKDAESVGALEALAALRSVRVSVGAGVALRLGRLARAEVNYCLPVSYRPGDQPQPGIQIGVGAQLL